MNEAYEFDIFEDITPDEKFIIDSPAKAEWAIEKIKSARARRDTYTEAVDAMIEQLKAKKEKAAQTCDTDTGFFLQALRVYLDSAPAKQSKTQKSLVLPSGKLVLKHSKETMLPDADKLLEYAKKSAPEYVEDNPKLKWGELKKDLEISAGAVVRKSTGEIIDGVTIGATPEQFEVE